MIFSEDLHSVLYECFCPVPLGGLFLRKGPGCATEWKDSSCGVTQRWDKELGFSPIGRRTCRAEDPVLSSWADSSGSSVVPKATMTDWLCCAEQLQIPTRLLSHHGAGVQVQYRVRSLTSSR